MIMEDEKLYVCFFLDWTMFFTVQLLVDVG